MTFISIYIYIYVYSSKFEYFRITIKKRFRICSHASYVKVDETSVSKNKEKYVRKRLEDSTKNQERKIK